MNAAHVVERRRLHLRAVRSDDPRQQRRWIRPLRRAALSAGFRPRQSLRTGAHLGRLALLAPRPPVHAPEVVTGSHRLVT
jgi:hypothetical protein